ncbi:MAG: cytochrome c oxidase subunit II [Chloroflexota bacterium]
MGRRFGGVAHLGSRIAGLAIVPLAASGCLPAPATTEGHAVTDLWMLFAVAAAAVGGLVWILITVALLRYRGAAHDPAGKAPPHPDPDERIPSPGARRALSLEVAWTLGPIAIVIVLFIATLLTLARMDAHEQSRTTVAITAFDWQWRFDYPGSGVSVVGGPGVPAEMVVPAGEPIHFELVSNDVDHSFYVPAFLFKRDAIPGRRTAFDLTIEAPGNYRGQCAEFCGVQHDRMLLTVRAVTRPEFDAWLAGRRSAPTPAPSGSGVAPTLAPSGSAQPSLELQQ